jgi:CRP/FNR family transcriptional regulator
MNQGGSAPVMKNTCSGLPYENDNSTWLDSFLLSFLEEPTCSTYGWGPVQIYPAHTAIIRQETPSNAVYFLKSGDVKLTWADRNGHEVIAGLRHQNWLIGAPSVLLAKPYSFTITTLTQCALRCISAQNFLHLIKTNTDFSFHLMKLLSQEIFNHARTLVTLGCVPLKERLKYLLVKFIPCIPSRIEGDKHIKISLPLKHKELAQILAVTPEHLSRLLKEMERQNEIKREKDGSIVLNLKSF